MLLCSQSKFNPIPAGVLENQDTMGGGGILPPPPLKTIFDVQICKVCLQNFK